MQPQVKVDLSGPFFQGDPSKRFLQNVHEMMVAVGDEGERAVQSVYPVYSGAGREGVHGRAASVSGKPWMATAVISETHVYPWPSGGSMQYRGGKAEAKVGMFKKTAAQLRSSRAVLAANLTKSIE